MEVCYYGSDIVEGCVSGAAITMNGLIGCRNMGG